MNIPSIEQPDKSGPLFYYAVVFALLAAAFYLGRQTGAIHKTLHPQAGLLATGIEIGYVARDKNIPLHHAMRISLANLPYKRADQWQIYWKTNTHQLQSGQ